MKNKIITIIVFYTKDKKILLQDRRSISKSGEEWGFFGGSFENDETPLQCVNRETKEELGVDLINYDLKFIGTRGATFEDGDSILKDKSYIYVAEFTGDLDEFILGEGDGMKLYTLDEARDLKVVSFDYIAYDLLEHYFNLRK